MNPNEPHNEPKAEHKNILAPEDNIDNIAKIPEAPKPATEEKPSGGLRFAEKVEALEKSLAEAEAKAQQNWDKALRAIAELENVRRRAEKDVESAHKYALERFAQALLPVLDTLEKALETKLEAEHQSMRQGVEMTYKMFIDTVAKFGLEQLNPLNQPFDPHLHEAVSMIESPGVAANTVMTVFQKGYRLNGRVVRPARVVVSQ